MKNIHLKKRDHLLLSEIFDPETKKWARKNILYPTTTTTTLYAESMNSDSSNEHLGYIMLGAGAITMLFAIIIFFAVLFILKRYFFCFYLIKK